MASSSDKKRAPTESKSDTKMTVTDSNSMDIKDGRIFEADNPLTLSKEEEGRFDLLLFIHRKDSITVNYELVFHLIKHIKSI